MPACKACGFKEKIASRECARAATADDRDRDMLCFGHSNFPTPAEASSLEHRWQRRLDLDQEPPTQNYVSRAQSRLSYVKAEHARRRKLMRQAIGGSDGQYSCPLDDDRPGRTSGRR